MLKPREERLRNLFAEAVVASGATGFDAVVEKASRSGARLASATEHVLFDHTQLVATARVINVRSMLQHDLSAVFYKITRGLFFEEYGREMSPVMHRAQFLHERAGVAMIVTLGKMGVKTKAQGAAFEWAQLSVGRPEDGIWLYKVMNAALVYVATGEASGFDVPAAQGLIVGGLPRGHGPVSRA